MMMMNTKPRLLGLASEFVDDQDGWRVQEERIPIQANWLSFILRSFLTDPRVLGSAGTVKSVIPWQSGSAESSPFQAEWLWNCSPKSSPLCTMGTLINMQFPLSLSCGHPLGLGPCSMKSTVLAVVDCDLT